MGRRCGRLGCGFGSILMLHVAGRCGQQTVNVHVHACAWVWLRRCHGLGGGRCRLYGAWRRGLPSGGFKQTVEIVVGKRLLRSCGRSCGARFVEQVVNLAGCIGLRGGSRRGQQFVQIGDLVVCCHRCGCGSSWRVKVVQQCVHRRISAFRRGHFVISFRGLRGNIKRIQQAVHLAHARHVELLVGVDMVVCLR